MVPLCGFFKRRHHCGRRVVRLTARVLLAEEIELRRHIERVAEQRRALPAGGAVPKSYSFIGENGPATFVDLFGDKQSLAIYSYMYGPKRERPCPMCTSLLSAWTAQCPTSSSGWRSLQLRASPSIGSWPSRRSADGHLKVYSDVSGDYTRDYVTAKDEDVPGFNVFSRSDGTIHSGVVRWEGKPQTRVRTRAERPI